MLKFQYILKKGSIDMRSKLTAVICASILFTACTGGNDQVATLPKQRKPPLKQLRKKLFPKKQLRRKLPQKFSKPLKPNLQRILTPCSMLNLHRFRKQTHLFPMMQSRLSKTCSKMRRMCTALSLTISMRTETPK